MTDEAWRAMAIIIPPLSVLLGRLWSRLEHKQTGKQIKDIYIMMNGDLKKRLNQAREEGKKSVLKKKKHEKK